VASRDQLAVSIAFWKLEDELCLLLALLLERVLPGALFAESLEALQLSSVELRTLLRRQMGDGSSVLALVPDPEDDRCDQDEEHCAAQQNAR
jgi:hypothetical protein